MRRNRVWIALGLIGMLIVPALWLSGCNFFYSTETDPHIYLSFEEQEDGTYVVSGFSGKAVHNVVIPATHNEKRVTGIADDAFGCKYNGMLDLSDLPLESVVIEEGITDIGSTAFHDREIGSVVLPDSVTRIGAAAFASTGAEIDWPAGLKQLGGRAFFGCTFRNDVDLTGVACDEYGLSGSLVRSIDIPQDWEAVPEGLFSFCEKLERVTLPAGLTRIEPAAFQRCTALSEIELPAGTAYIGDSAFEYSGIRKVVFENEGLEIAERAFAHSEIREVVFENETLNIADYAFQNCTNLDRLVFPSRGNVTLEESFSGCLALETVDFGDSVFLFETTPFTGCPVRDMRVGDDSEMEIVDGCLCRRESDGTYTVLVGCAYPVRFDNFSDIEDYAFSGKRLGSIRLGANIRDMGVCAFSGAIIDSAELACDEIGGRAFYSAEISELRISSRQVGDQAFYSVEGLTEVVLEEGCEEIDSQAFSNCGELQRVYLPASLKKVEYRAFAECSELTEVYYALRQGVPVTLHVGHFATRVRRGEEEGWGLKDDFRIYVYDAVYGSCKVMWEERPADPKYTYIDSLADRVVRRD